MSKWKKHKLTLPPVALRFIHPELARRQGEISNMWDESLIKAYPDWFEEIPAEPVVLSAEDVCIKLGFSPDAHRFEQLVVIAKEAIRNGRLERDLELRGLVESVENLISGENHKTMPNHLYDIRLWIKDLKPLNKD